MNAQHIIQTTAAYEVTWHVKAHTSLYVIFEQRGAIATTARITAILEPNAQLELVPLILDGQLNELYINLQLGQSAQAIVKGAYALCGTQKAIIRVNQHHQGARSQSNVTLNGVATDGASIDYAGIIIIDPTANKSVASQENKTILWSETAKAQSIPSLEVKTNDVQCAHGSAIGYLNKEHLWYAQTRGMSIKQAQRILLKSFFWRH